MQDELSVIINCDVNLVKDDELTTGYKVIEREYHTNGTISKKAYTVIYIISNGNVDCICDFSA